MEACSSIIGQVLYMHVCVHMCLRVCEEMISHCKRILIPAPVMHVCARARAHARTQTHTPDNIELGLGLRALNNTRRDRNGR